MDNIIIRIPLELKKKFKDNCDSLGISMSEVIISKIIEFNEEFKKQMK